ncbi:conserved hypothetical protein [Psychromonas ingrahamii 37]|uniref:YnbE-like lipoprotein n=1 Tax=Psychromonas ingrahamii (strain DSM 17664 / CCUG 51855 / 37) TaxID=357804 RepID=A1SSK7_PSYIN|nr:YnbE family lipoprotein [Psychromonas ingrahamii]ABM02472.1 conserved hypothetical protein [Psychromonas ingrahamii 37]
MLKRIIILFPLIIIMSACTPRVELAMPSEPITINLNVKIDHQIRVKVDQQLDELFNDESGLF